MEPIDLSIECPNQTVDESFCHTFSDIHPQGTNADNEIGVPKSPTNEAMGEIFQRKEEVHTNSGTASNSSAIISKKSVLTIVLDLNGLLLKRCQQQPFSIHKPVQMST